MAGIETYPTGTPGAGDQVPYVADPAGTPALKLADAAGLGGWTTISADPMTSLAGWTTLAGTWNVTGGQIVMTSLTGAYSYMRSAILPTHAVVRASVEFQVAAWGSDTRVGLIVAADAPSATAQPAGYYARIGGVETIRLEEHNNTTRITNAVPTPLAAATWHQITVEIAGMAMAARIGDGAAMMRDNDTQLASAYAPRFFIMGYSDVDVTFRNFVVEGL